MDNNYVTDQTIPKEVYVLERVKQYAEYMAKNNRKIKPLELLAHIKQHEFDYEMDNEQRLGDDHIG